MSDEPFKDLYKNIELQVYPHIENQERGVLHTVIHIILETEQWQAKEICNRCNIKGSNFLEKDQEIISSFFNIFINKRIEAKYVHNSIKDLLNKFNHDNISREDKMKWIIAVACAIVGVYACHKYLDNQTKNKSLQEQKKDSTQQKQSVSTPKKITASLCLVVPASEVSNLSNGSNISNSKIEQLIDVASYFLCTETEDADKKQQLLETKTFVPSESNKDVYIRIDITEGQEIIGKISPYILKRDLPKETRSHVEKIAYLKNLSGLETFNRI